MESVNILVAGDFCVRGKGEEYVSQAKEIMEELKQRISQADISMINVETVFTDIQRPIKKSGPPLSSSVSSLQLLKELGFDIAACANNHIFDQGAENMLSSIDRLRSIGMKVIGAGENLREASKPVYIEKKGKRFGFLNFCEHEFGIAENEQPGAAGIDIYKNAEIIKHAKENADFIVVYIHAGCEELPIPRPGLIKLCRMYAQMGASAVITAHSHCPVGYEMYNGVPICYGLGNFYFPANGNIDGKFWNVGYMAELIFSDLGITINPIPYTFGRDGEYIRLLNDNENDLFREYLGKISDIIHNDSLYSKLWRAWCHIYVSGWPREFINKFCIENTHDDEYVLFMRNTYTCESHAEVFRTYYTDYCNNQYIENEYIELIRELQRNNF